MLSLWEKGTKKETSSITSVQVTCPTRGYWNMTPGTVIPVHPFNLSASVLKQAKKGTLHPLKVDKNPPPDSKGPHTKTPVNPLEGMVMKVQ